MVASAPGRTKREAWLNSRTCSHRCAAAVSPSFTAASSARYAPSSTPVQMVALAAATAAWSPVARPCVAAAKPASMRCAAAGACAANGSANATMYCWCADSSAACPATALPASWASSRLVRRDSAAAARLMEVGGAAGAVVPACALALCGASKGTATNSTSRHAQYAHTCRLEFRFVVVSMFMLPSFCRYSGNVIPSCATNWLICPVTAVARFCASSPSRSASSGEKRLPPCSSAYTPATNARRSVKPAATCLA